MIKDYNLDKNAGVDNDIHSAIFDASSDPAISHEFINSELEDFYSSDIETWTPELIDEFLDYEEQLFSDKINRK